MLNLSWRRAWLIAQRDYLGYVKTFGFWLSFALPIVFGALGFMASQAGLDFESTRYETVLDETGAGVGDAILEFWEAERADLVAAIPEALQGSVDADDLDTNLVFVPPPASTLEGLQPYLRGERTVEVDGEPRELDGLLRLVNEGGEVRASYWSRNITADRVPDLAERYFRDQSRAAYLQGGGLSLEGYRAAGDTAPVPTFDPTATITPEGAEQVTFTDRLPYLVAAGAALFLWFTVFSGAYMLLTSMLEEKLGKLLEMLLATTRFAEVMLGKLLGVALLTVTALAPYLLIGTVVVYGLLTQGDPEVVAGIRQAVTLKMVIFFPLFLVLGYVLYGAMFIALGSLSESMQDAQTLTVPIMVILTACVLVLPIGLNDPDAPIVVLASWIPLSAPFANIVRLPSDPAWWELGGAALVLVLTTLGVMALATLVFRQGVLGGGGVKAMMAALWNRIWPFGRARSTSGA